jgi:acetylornithine/N-succinyldiaminopimelate aminotransferase
LWPPEARPQAIPPAVATAPDTAPAPAHGVAPGPHSLSRLLPNYARADFHPLRGKGARLFDLEGRPHWDLLAGIAVNALGYGHPRLRRALREQSAHGVLHVSNLFHHPAPERLAERLVELSGLARAFFCNSGTEANEAALKIARKARPGRPGCVALEESFHGRTLGALSLTGHAAYRAPFEPLPPAARFVPPNDVTALERAVDRGTAAIFLEPILGEGGVIPLDAGYLRAARRIADREGALLVLDEIQCGLGRTGAMFAFEAAGIRPDMVTLAKPLGGGLPLGCVLTAPGLTTTLAPGDHGTTFGGNPLACRLGIEVLEALSHDGLLQRVAGMGVWLEERLAALQRRQHAIVDIRGRGLMWGIEMDREAGPVARALLTRGFVVGTARSNVLRLLPPYVVPKRALSAFMRELGAILEGTV